MQTLHDDERLLIVSKPPGLLVHRSALDAHEDDTALDRLQRHTGLRLWPAHRLDKGTSGVLVFAKDADAARTLGAAFEAGSVAKRYRALVRGWPGEQGRIDHPLARDPERPSAGQPMRESATRWRGTSGPSAWTRATRAAATRCCSCGPRQAGATRSAGTASTSATRWWATARTAKARTTAPWPRGWAWPGCGCMPSASRCRTPTMAGR